MLNKKSLEILNSINNLTNTIVLSYPLTSFSNGVADSIKGIINWSDIDSSQFEEFGIYNLGEFLSITRLFENPEIKQIGSLISLSGGSSSTRYVTSNIVQCKKQSTCDPELFNRLSSYETKLKFELPSDVIKSLLKAGSAYSSQNLNEIIISGTRGSDKINLSIANESALNSGSSTYETFVPTTVAIKETFKFKTTLENFASIPLYKDSYKVEVKFNTARGNSALFLYNDFIKLLISSKVGRTK